MKKNPILENEIIDIRNKMGLITEAKLPIIQQGDDLCDILCGIKQAKYGSNGNAVREIQHALYKCGYNIEKVGGGIDQACKASYKGCDGLFREETRKAVIEFQKANDLKQDGAVGYNTLTKMGSKNIIRDINPVIGCLKLPKCNCNTKRKKLESSKDKTIKKEGREDWWSLIDGGSSKMNDCDTINKCLYKAIKKCKSNKDPKCFQKTFFSCMRGDKNPTKGD